MLCLAVVVVWWWAWRGAVCAVCGVVEEGEGRAEVQERKQMESRVSGWAEQDQKRREKDEEE